MIVGIQDIYYNVSDVQRAIKFYSEALQMNLKFSHEGWTAMDCHGISIGLHPLESGEKIDHVGRNSHGAFGQATLTLKSNDVPQDRDRIIKCGGKILGEEDAPWGHMLVFEDPDGNVLKLMNPKY